jgi:hypothetical protein
MQNNVPKPRLSRTKDYFYPSIVDGPLSPITIGFTNVLLMRPNLVYRIINSIIKPALDNHWMLLCCVLFASTLAATAQQTILSGKVLDSHTNEPLPYVNVYIKGTNIGAISDTAGFFKLIIPTKSDSVYFSAVGFHTTSMAIKTNSRNTITVKLEPDNIALKSINVAPDDGPMRALFKNITDNKKKNNPEKHQRFEYEKYTKWEYRVNNVGDKLAQSNLFKSNPSVFKTDSANNRYLPVYFSEQIVHNEFQRAPLRQKSTILADKTSGIGLLNDYQISGYTSGLDIEVNFYDNFINLFSQNFVSPIADNGWFYYKYYLADSTITQKGTLYKVRFVPRRVGDKVFIGYFTVEDQRFSLVDMDAKLASTSQINFLKRMRLAATYQAIDDTIPFYKRNLIEANIDYMPIQTARDSQRIEVAYTQLSVIDKVKVGIPEPIELTKKNLAYESVAVKGAYSRDTAYWNQARAVQLTETDLMLYTTIDSVNQIPTIKKLDQLGRMFMTGYYDVGKIEIGPYDYMINLNKVEGTHLFFGARTSSEVWENHMVWGGLGYGTLNKEFVGRLGYGCKFDTPGRQVMKLFYSDDIIRIGENEKILYLYENMLSPSENNLVSYFFQRDELDELIRQHRVAATYEHEWYSGLMSKLNLQYLRQSSPVFYPFVYNGDAVSGIDSYDASIDFRWSWKEKFIDDGFQRLYYSTDYPIVHLTIGGGKYQFADVSSSYGRVHATIKQNVFLQQAYLKYAIEGGAYFGKLPYTLLEIPRGNETYGYYTYDFNLMNYLEFVHDRYAHAYFEYHMNGLFFKRLPLLKHLGLREVVSAKGMVGDLSDKQTTLINLPSSISAGNGKPYLEVGIGAENVLRFFRVEGIYRVTHANNMLAPRFGIRVKFEVKL